MIIEIMDMAVKEAKEILAYAKIQGDASSVNFDHWNGVLEIRDKYHKIITLRAEIQKERASVVEKIQAEIRKI